MLSTTLTDGFVTLRRYEPAFAPALFEAARESQGEIYQWLPWCHPDYGLSDSEEWTASRVAEWEAGRSYDFAIFDPAGRFVGGCGLNQIDPIHKSANLGYWVRTSACGQGVASSATRLLGPFGLRELGLVRVEVVAAVGNEGSRKAAEKSGAIYEGVLRNRLVIHGEPHDAHIFCFVP